MGRRGRGLVSGEVMLIFSFFQNEHNSNLNNFSYVGTVHLFPKSIVGVGLRDGSIKLELNNRKGLQKGQRASFSAFSASKEPSLFAIKEP